MLSNKYLCTNEHHIQIQDIIPAINNLSIDDLHVLYYKIDNIIYNIDNRFAFPYNETNDTIRIFYIYNYMTMIKIIFIKFCQEISDLANILLSCFTSILSQKFDIRLNYGDKYLGYISTRNIRNIYIYIYISIYLFQNIFHNISNKEFCDILHKSSVDKFTSRIISYIYSSNKSTRELLIHICDIIIMLDDNMNALYSDMKYLPINNNYKKIFDYVDKKYRTTFLIFHETDDNFCIYCQSSELIHALPKGISLVKYNITDNININNNVNNINNNVSNDVNNVKIYSKCGCC
jgi:hypothetical protein